MGVEYLMIMVFPALEDVYKLLAVVVALYFPVAMLVWLAVDKLHKPSENRAEAHPAQTSHSHTPLALGQQPPRDP
jgi:hypothetical protein